MENIKYGIFRFNGKTWEPIDEFTSMISVQFQTAVEYAKEISEQKRLSIAVWAVAYERKGLGRWVGVNAEPEVICYRGKPYFNQKAIDYLLKEAAQTFFDSFRSGEPSYEAQ